MAAGLDRAALAKAAPLNTLASVKMVLLHTEARSALPHMDMDSQAEYPGTAV